MTRSWLIVLAAVLLAGCDQSPVDSTKEGGQPATRPALNPQASAGDGWREQARAACAKGVRYLQSIQKDGTWPFEAGKDPEVGITALCLLAILESPSKPSADEPGIRAGLDWLVSNQKPDGSIHAGMLASYNTAVSVLALVASRDPKYRTAIDQAVEYLRLIQSDEGEDVAPSDRFYGGVGYEDGGRPDLSNTQLSLDAVKAGGLKDDDPFYKKAVKFLERSQNRSESNDLKDGDLVSGNDGGAYYSPISDVDEQKAGLTTLPDGKKIRTSYGSMSYALLKSYLFCNLSPRDPRVQAVIGWLSKNYRVDYNPGFESRDKPEGRYSGLYYYYLTMARTLGSYKGDLIFDEAGKPRTWRQDLATVITALQKPDGRWVNDRNSDWWESSPALATSMALNALNACLR